MDPWTELNKIIKELKQREIDAQAEISQLRKQLQEKNQIIENLKRGDVIESPQRGLTGTPPPRSPTKRVGSPAPTSPRGANTSRPNTAFRSPPASPRGTKSPPNKRGIDYGDKYPLFYKGTVYTPTNVEGEDGPPPVSLEPEYIYGYSMKGCKNNVLNMTKNGELIYPAAGSVVILDHTTNTQRIFTNHNDDTQCVDLHPDGESVASGQLGKENKIYVWNSSTLKIQATILTNTVFTKGGVIALSFNSDGTKIAVLGGTNVEVTLAIYDWKKNLLLAQTKAETQEAYFVGWNLVDQTIATGYLKSCKFFSYENGALSSKKAVFGNLSGTSNSILSIAYDNKGNAFIGASDGNLYLFKGNRVEATYEAHKGPVHTVSKSKGGLLSGGKDGNVVLWKQNENGKIVKLHTYAMGGPVRSVLASKTEDEVCYVLLFSGQMYRVEYSGFDNTKTLIMNSHQSKVKEELWALAVIPGQDVILSGADDGRILVWNASSKKCLNDIAAPNKPKIRSIAVSPGYEVGDIHVAVGTFDGWLHVYSAADLLENPKAQPLISKEVGKKEEIAAMAYSPNGSYLAVASHDNFTYILKAEEDYKRKAVLSGHSSFVKAVDWSDDGQYLQTTCGAHELLYWEATTFQLHQSPELANVNWHNQTVALGWSVRGIWDANMDGSDINSIHVSQNLGVIACGDDRSHVRLVKYPTITTNPVKVDYQGHCSHVTNVRFSSDSTKLYSAGGADLSVIQWKVT